MSDWNDDVDLGDLGFNSDDVEVPKIDLLPPGRYPLICTGAKVEPSRNTPTTVLANIEETIADGDHKGRKIWSRYVVAHADPKVMARGRADVVRMMQAYGVGGASLTPCVGRQCIGAVDVEPAKGDFEARNRVKRREVDAAASSAPVSPSRPSAPAQSGPPRAAAPFLANRKG